MPAFSLWLLDVESYHFGFRETEEKTDDSRNPTPTRCVFRLRFLLQGGDDLEINPHPSLTVGGLLRSICLHIHSKHWTNNRFTSILSTGHIAPMLTQDQSPRATKQLGRTMSVVLEAGCHATSFLSAEWTLISSTSLWILCNLCRVWSHRGRMAYYLPKTLRDTCLGFLEGTLFRIKVCSV